MSVRFFRKKKTTKNAPVIGANARQKGLACELRNNGVTSYEDRKKLNHIIHSGDVFGKYSATENKYRDLRNQFDERAQDVLQATAPPRPPRRRRRRSRSPQRYYPKRQQQQRAGSGGGWRQQRIGADAVQKGRACEMRNNGFLGPSDRLDLNQIVHSGDIVGKYSKTANYFRDTQNNFDNKAEDVLDTSAMTSYYRAADPEYRLP